MTDAELLQRYVRDHSQAAFAQLVGRYVDLVYSAALRQVRSRESAEEVAQSVFLDLSRRAAQLKPQQPLAGWLYVVTRRTAVDLIRSETRRQRREQTAAEIAAVMKTPSSSWPQIEGLVDEAMETLDETDRAALVLRYFQNLSLREVGAALGISDDTAQKRISRALDRLREPLLRRGVTVTAAGLATNLSAHALQLAPAGLGAAIAAAPAFSSLALGPAAQAGSSLLTMTSAKIAFAATVAAMLIGAASWEALAVSDTRAALAVTATRSLIVDADLSRLRRERTDAVLQLRTTQAEIARLAATPETELDAEVAAWFARTARLHELAAQHPEQTIPEFALLTDKDWFNLGREAKFETDEDRSQQLRNLRNQARSRLGLRLREALVRYVDAHDGRLPDEVPQIAAFVVPPITPEMLGRYAMLQRGNLVDVPFGEWLLEEKNSFDEAHDDRLFLTRANGGRQPFSDVRAPDLRAALQAYTAAHAGQLPTAPAQVLPYFSRPPSPLALATFLQQSPADFAPEKLRELLTAD